jgi:hypothetical protein
MSGLVVVAAFADVFKTVVGVLLALVGLGVLVMGVVGLADRSWKSGAIYAGVGAAVLGIGLHLAGALGDSVRVPLGVVASLAGLLLVVPGLVGLSAGPTRGSGIAMLLGGLALILGGLWVMRVLF